MRYRKAEDLPAKKGQQLNRNEDDEKEPGRGLPPSAALDTEALKRSVRRRGAAERILWLYEICNDSQTGTGILDCRTLSAEVMAEAWHMSETSGINFSEHDILGKVTSYMKNEKKMPGRISRKKLEERIMENTDPVLSHSLLQLSRNLPVSFIQPFYEEAVGCLREREIVTNSYQARRAAEGLNSLEKLGELYILHMDEGFIEITPEWLQYIRSNQGQLKKWLNSELKLCMEKNNCRTEKKLLL